MCEAWRCICLQSVHCGIFTCMHAYRVGVFCVSVWDLSAGAVGYICRGCRMCFVYLCMKFCVYVEVCGVCAFMYMWGMHALCFCICVFMYVCLCVHVVLCVCQGCGACICVCVYACIRVSMGIVPVSCCVWRM